AACRARTRTARSCRASRRPRRRAPTASATAAAAYRSGGAGASTCRTGARARAPRASARRPTRSSRSPDVVLDARPRGARAAGIDGSSLVQAALPGGVAHLAAPADIEPRFVHLAQVLLADSANAAAQVVEVAKRLALARLDDPGRH